MNASSSMKASKWLQVSEGRLIAADITTAHLDALVLLEDEIGKDRGWLLSHPEYELQGSVLEKLSTKIAQRSQHIPLAYIRGKAEFYGREFIVNVHTLVPRPETETIIELLKSILSRHPKLDLGSSQVNSAEGTKHKLDSSLRWNDNVQLVDIGTGSGAIAITAKLELPGATVIATDIDEKCLETARQNAHNLGADISFLHSNLLRPLEALSSKLSPLILLCNLPYVPDNFQINTAATHEPRHALFGGPDGLDLYRELFQQIQAGALKPQYVLTESLPPQHELLADIAKAAGYSLEHTDDFIQVFQQA